MRLEDLEVLVHGHELTIKGHRKPVDGEKAIYHRRERTLGEFSRFLTLPVEIDADAVEADLKDGVLTVIMPKAARAKARRIAVQAK